MLDGKYKNEMDACWDRLGRLVVKLHLSANVITWIGLLLVIASCLVFLVTRNTWLFVVALGSSFTADALDGSVARLTGTSSKDGAYLDAVLDRYQEIVVFFTIAYVKGYWPLCFAAMSGSLLISYHKARAGMEVPVANTNWPDLLERTERILLLLAGLLLEAIFPDKDLLWHGLLLFAILTHITAVQRFLRGRRIVREYRG